MSTMGEELMERLTRLEVEAATIPELYERLDQLLVELELTRGNRDAMQRELQAECDRLGGVIESMSTSLSWRITRPLRTVLGWLRR